MTLCILGFVGSQSGVGQGDFSEVSRLQQELDAHASQLSARNNEIVQLVILTTVANTPE